MNRMEELARLFGVELNEPFKVMTIDEEDSDIRFKFTEKGLMSKPCRGKWEYNPFAYPIMETVLIEPNYVEIKKTRKKHKHE